eukprot:gb/GFBE01061495.1/.p1 GENE.gb/GFBE01061495.1/~~gb/GFBE01061495.1/.p1  ORF type:complete len:153 (+),score=22.28 gb/GFBE01061495.1/:1-459(+)
MMSYAWAGVVVQLACLGCMAANTSDGMAANTSDSMAAIASDGEGEGGGGVVWSMPPCGDFDAEIITQANVQKKRTPPFCLWGGMRGCYSQAQTTSSMWISGQRMAKGALARLPARCCHHIFQTQLANMARGGNLSLAAATTSTIAPSNTCIN